MTTDQKIAAVCRSVPGLTYHYNDWTKANADLEALPFPVLLSLLPASGDFHLINGQLRDYPEGSFAFLDKTEFDFDAAENETVVARMKAAAMAFISEINRSGLFEPVGGRLHYQVVYDKLDICVTGIVLSVQLKERTGICLPK